MIYVRIPPSPCLDCQERNAICHTKEYNCERYQQFEAEKQECYAVREREWKTRMDCISTTRNSKYLKRFIKEQENKQKGNK